jgi:hypothetical protein
MDTDTTELFCRQLAIWAETAIEQGRYPFRKVETYPAVLTKIGEMRPPLIFWINRDSFMAGGLLLLPRQEAEEAVEMGRQCARSLGLRHFVTWAAREIVFWEDLGSSVTRRKTLPLKGTGCNATADFRDALTVVMSELKVLCVLGTVAPLQLPPHYLANLCLSSLDTALPPIEEGYRVARSERRLETKGPTAELAFAKGVLSLLRLLALSFHDRLPNTIQPEGLERAMLFALDTLPPALRTVLQPAGDDVALPPESAIRFHHLLRRLTQLQCDKDRHRAAQAVEVLLIHLAKRLGGLPLPFAPEPTAGPTLLLNPERLDLNEVPLIEVASPALLGLLALLRDLQSSPPVQLQTADPFNLSPAPPLAAIRGSLTDESIPDEAGRRLLAARLRVSWPTRHLALPPRTPTWAWTFVHLLGLAEAGAAIAIQIPSDWLVAAYGSRLQHFLAEECVLHFLSQDAAGRLQLRLTRAQDPEAVCTLLGPEGPRQLSWQRLAAGHRSFYRLALELPDELFRLLEEGRLQIPDAAGWPETSERTIFLYTRSALGSWLWALVSGGQSLPTAQSLRTDSLRFGLPLPAAGIMKELQQLAGEEAENLTQAVFDAELLRLLGVKLSLPAHAARKTRPRPRTHNNGQRPTSEELAEQIIAKVFIDGLPRFPEQYLYAHFRPALHTYAFSGPLRIQDEFFGRVQLVDSLNNILEIDGREPARALQLASYDNRSSVGLPVDQELTAAICARYLSDLRGLRRELTRQCHMQIIEPRAADAMVEQIWQSLPLPPWPLVEP